VEASRGGAELTPTANGRKYRGAKCPIPKLLRNCSSRKNSFNKASVSVELKVLNSPSSLWILISGGCCGVWLRRWSLRLSQWRGNWLRLDAAAGGELAAVRDIPYEDR
jgi:hypothetical protein